MWVDSIFLWPGFDLVMVRLCLVLSFDKVFFSGIRKATKKRVFCSIDNQEKSLKATGYFIFHQAVFKFFICPVLVFYTVVHICDFV